MRCLYCGKELALLKRLTGGGDFCSEAHKQSYQEEYNRLALSRLLQAQKKKQQGGSSPTDIQAPPDTSIALQEPVTTERDKATEAPVLSLAVRGTSVDAPSPVALAENVAVSEDQPEPSKEAGFQLELPASTEIPEPEPYLYPWLEMTGGVMASRSVIDSNRSHLSLANLLSFEFTPTASGLEHASPSDTDPETFSGSPAYSSLSSGLRGDGTASRSDLGGTVAGATGLLVIGIPPISSVLNADYSFVQGLEPDFRHAVQESAFLTLPPARIDWSGDENDVPIDSSHWVLGPSTAGQGEDETPRSSIEALSRLHQELVEERFGSNAETAASEPEANLVPGLVDTAAASIDVSSPEPEPHRPAASEKLFEIPIKLVVPAKPALVGATALPPQTLPVLPQMRSLPLRSKIALATGYSPVAPTVVTPDPQPIAPVPVPAPPPSTDTDHTKPSSNSPQPKQALQPPKARTSPATKPSEPPKSVAVKPPGIQPDLKETKATAEPAKPVEDRPKPAPLEAKPASPQITSDEAVPSFGLAPRTNVSWLGSLKLKLGLAIILVAGASTYFLGWGSKDGKPVLSNTAVSGDGVGPSIIMGEGGWVENWGGDPAGMHAGREITIYRPSLKLSDYRLQFQGSIDTKSIGWVFRAADPSNYYAMKLMSVSSSLPLKVALFKYLVVNGRQTQVGRVPIDLPVDADTLFDIRVDVRGPQFTTYIQGQQVDSWTDDQLKIGGAGFLNEREERGKVKSVSIRYLSGGAK